MAENLRKVLLYFRPGGSYWSPTDPAEKLAIDTGPIRRYPLDIVPRVESGHFAQFDDSGLPTDPARDGSGWIHNYTTICAYALAHWDMYLLTGDESKLKVVFQAGDYILRTADYAPGGPLKLRHEYVGSGHVGALSGMFQGEAASVLCRCYQHSRDNKYLDAARAALLTYDIPVDEDGVLGLVTKAANAPWYEEDCGQPLRHILNGMVYSVWGAMDLHATAPDEKTAEWVKRGVDSIVAALPLFDSGFWSWYDVPEAGAPYIASMMYHNLHICQLEGLYRLTGRKEFKEAATRFTRYAGSPTCRLRAASSILFAKLLKTRRSSH